DGGPDGHRRTDRWTSFRGLCGQCLAPMLKCNDIVVMDNLPAHKVPGVKEVTAAGPLCGPTAGGSISPLEKHTAFLLGLIEKQPDLTLDEVVLALRKHNGSVGQASPSTAASVNWMAP